MPPRWVRIARPEVSWSKSSYCRLLVDNHITEDHPSFLTRFDPEQFVATVASAGFDACMVYACCHNGNCYYPTRVGLMHANLVGRDIFGETTSLLRARGVKPVAYYTVVWHNQSAKDHPLWRFQDFTGRQNSGRYWLSCPNNPDYRAFCEEQIQEIASYDVDGLFIDMTFWPGICYCPQCRERFRAEIGGEMPSTVDWFDPKWVGFQRARERWLNEFAHFLSGAAKAEKPGLTVVHQFSPVLIGWYLAQNADFSKASDYASGDFYGGRLQQRLGTKVFDALTTSRPYEFMTSRCVNLYDHTSMKPTEELLASAATTLANGGAYFFIDAINPDGTLSAATYERFARVNETLAPVTARMRETCPQLLGDVGLYCSLDSHVDERMNGTGLADLLKTTSISNMESVCQIRAMQELLGASALLNRMHQPYVIATARDEDLSRFRTIILCGVTFLSVPEVERLRRFVADGGTLVATGATSLCDSEGASTGDFALADVFGVHHSGRQSARINYLQDPDGNHVLCDRPAPLVSATTAEVRAWVAEPWFDPDDDRYASIHSNPPGPRTEFAAYAVNRFGQGTCVYLNASWFAMRQDAQQVFCAGVLSEHLQSGFRIATDAPEAVEITLLRSEAGNSLLAFFVNYQDAMPNIPISNIRATVTLPFAPELAKATPVFGNIRAAAGEDGSVTIQISNLETLAAIEIPIKHSPHP